MLVSNDDKSGSFANMRKERSTPLKVIYTLVFLWVILSLLAFSFMDEKSVLRLTMEDGVVESAGAVFFLLASIVFMISFLRSRPGNDFFMWKTKRNLFFLVLSLLFFVACGEEISWGQRMLSIRAPEYFQSHNIQKEINIHNLQPFHRLDDKGEEKGFVSLLLNIDRLFSAFWFSYVVLIPLGEKCSRKVSGCLRKINVPVPPLEIGFLFVVNFAMEKFMEHWYKADFSQPLTEIKETNFALLFLLLGCYFFWCQKKGSERTFSVS